MGVRAAGLLETRRDGRRVHSSLTGDDVAGLWAHLPGALHIPLEGLADRIAELPRGKQVVASCRGEYCVLATTPSVS